MSHKCGFTGEQEGWWGWGRDHRKKESHPALQTPPEPSNIRGARGKRREPGGWRMSSCWMLSLVLFDGCRGGDRDWASNEGGFFCWRARSPVPQTNTGRVLHPFLLFLSLSPAEHSWQTKLQHSSLTGAAQLVRLSSGSGCSATCCLCDARHEFPLTG